MVENTLFRGTTKRFCIYKAFDNDNQWVAGLRIPNVEVNHKYLIGGANRGSLSATSGITKDTSLSWQNLIWGDVSVYGMAFIGTATSTEFIVTGQIFPCVLDLGTKTVTKVYENTTGGSRQTVTINNATVGKTYIICGASYSTYTYSGITLDEANSQNFVCYGNPPLRSFTHVGVATSTTITLGSNNIVGAAYRID